MICQALRISIFNSFHSVTRITYNVHKILQGVPKKWARSDPKWPRPSERTWMAQSGPKFRPPIIALKILKVHFFWDTLYSSVQQHRRVLTVLRSPERLGGGKLSSRVSPDHWWRLIFRSLSPNNTLIVFQSTSS